MTLSDIISIICTAVLSLLIFWLERRQVKKDKKEAEKNRIAELKHKAEIFLIENGDEIEIDIPNRKLNLLVTDDILETRRKNFIQPEQNIKSGYLSKYSTLVQDASHGAII
jgi:hypothetical protein